MSDFITPAKFLYELKFEDEKLSVHMPWSEQIKEGSFDLTRCYRLS